MVVITERPAGEFQPSDEVLRVSEPPAGTWKCPRTSQDRSHLVSAVELLHSRAVSLMSVDESCNDRSLLPTALIHQSILGLLY